MASTHAFERLSDQIALFARTDYLHTTVATHTREERLEMFRSIGLTIIEDQRGKTG